MVCGRADKILKKIEKMSQNESLPIIGSNKGQILLEVIRDIKPKRVLEVGTLVAIVPTLHATRHVYTYIHTYTCTIVLLLKHYYDNYRYSNGTVCFLPVRRPVVVSSSTRACSFVFDGRSGR